MDDLPAPVVLSIRSATSVSRARLQARRLARALGFSRVDVEIIVLCVSELGNNLWQHATEGTLALEPLGPPRVGLRVRTEDAGPGIADLAYALQDGISSRGGMGSGLAGVRRLMDRFEIWSRPGEGTRTEAIKWRS